jgi:hypothetical protein
MTPIRHFAAFLICALICGPALAATGSHQESAQQAPCCFENPRFSGTCEVTPGEGESCSSVLGYLNNPNSIGKDYCGNTQIRGGWSQVSCEPDASAATPTSCGNTEPREQH